MKRAVWTAALCLWLAACQTPLPPPTSTASPQAQAQWERTRERLAAIRSFELQGRIAGSGLGVSSADLSWEQNDDHFLVLLSGTFGVGAMRVEGTPDDLIITTKDGRYRADDAEAALNRELGAPLPLADLRYWVLGLPRPQAAATVTLDDQGRLSRLDQDGWSLDYLDYRETAPSSSLPHRLSLERNGNRWKIVIDQWKRLS